MYNTLIQQDKVFKAGIYIRLSEADEGKNYETDSESVLNQRNILMKFIKEKGFIFVDEYVDDGFSGTDFERPGFMRMIEDIKNKVINLVIVKDLSRLGRDHIMTGYYIETFFPENGIRFISMQEGYDNALNQASNDSSTFIIACNDYYSKQNSIKIRNVLNDKRRNGKFIGSMPSYGYMRDPEDKGHLIPDPEYAPIVKKILKNQMYTGDMVQSVQTKVSYKSKKKKTLPRSNWDIVKNTHEALVDRITFERVQNNVKRTNKTINTNRDKRLFENLMFCRECGNTLTVSYRKNHNYWTVNCNRYSRDPRRRMCEPHFMPYDKLEEALLDTIKKTCKKYIEQINISELSKEIANKKKNTNQNKERITEFQNKEKEYLNKLDVLYEDKFRGIVSEETYKRIASETEKLLTKIRIQIGKLKDEDKVIKSKTSDLKEYEEKIKKLIDIENPTRELLQTIVDKIIIDKDKNVEIIYKFSILD